MHTHTLTAEMYWLLKLGLCSEVKQDESHGEPGSSDRTSGRLLDTQPLSEPLEPLPDRQCDDDPELSVATHTHKSCFSFISTTHLTLSPSSDSKADVDFLKEVKSDDMKKKQRNQT